MGPLHAPTTANVKQCPSPRILNNCSCHLALDHVVGVERIGNLLRPEPIASTECDLREETCCFECPTSGMSQCQTIFERHLSANEVAFSREKIPGTAQTKHRLCQQVGRATTSSSANECNLQHDSQPSTSQELSLPRRGPRGPMCATAARSK